MNKIALIALASIAGVASAQPASFIDLGTIGGEGSYTFDTNGTEAFLFGDPNSFVDTELGLYDAAGNVLASDDDGGDGFLSSITATLSAGVYYLAVSEFDSVFEDGFINSGSNYEDGDNHAIDHNINDDLAGEATAGVDSSIGFENRTQFFAVTVVPAPAAAGILALGGLVATRRRRA